MIHCFFGSIAAGKSFYAKQHAIKYNLPFIEGDDFLPHQLSRSLKQGIPLTRKQVDSFIYDNLIPALEQIKYPHFTLAQALYRNEYRLAIQSLFPTTFYWVKPTRLQHLQNLSQRHPRWIPISILSSFWFQKPTHPYIPVP